MKKWKSDKGSITLFVLIALLFFIGILLSSYLISINSRKAQEDATQRVKDIYEKDIGRMEEIYQEIYEKENPNNPIPIPKDIMLSTTEWTNQDITATILYPFAEGMTNQYSLNGTNWNTYKGPITISQNQTIYARITDGEEYGHTISKQVTNIDKIKPNISADNPKNAIWTNQNVVVTATGTDNESGINYIQYKVGNGEWNNLSTTNGIATSEHTTEMNETIYYRAYDKAGNVSTQASTKVMIDKTPPSNPTIAFVSQNGDSTGYVNLETTTRWNKWYNGSSLTLKFTAGSEIASNSQSGYNYTTLYIRKLAITKDGSKYNIPSYANVWSSGTDVQNSTNLFPSSGYSRNLTFTDNNTYGSMFVLLMNTMDKAGNTSLPRVVGDAIGFVGTDTVINGAFMVHSPKFSS